MHGHSIEYRNIPGFPGYRVGNDGSVWSQWKRVGTPGKRGTMFILGNAWRQLKPTAQRSGHLRVALYPGAIRRLVHHLVLEAFIGPRPEGMECCHFPDRNPANNQIDNLRWDTPTANGNDAARHGTRARGETQGAAKLTSESVLAIRADHATGLFSQRQLAQKYGVDQTNIGQIVRRKSWRHI
jgi:hypothetical protein